MKWGDAIDKGIPKSVRIITEPGEYAEALAWLKKNYEKTGTFSLAAAIRKGVIGVAKDAGFRSDNDEE